MIFTGYNKNVWFTKYAILFFPLNVCLIMGFTACYSVIYIRSVHLLMLLKLCLLMNGIWGVFVYLVIQL